MNNRIRLIVIIASLFAVGVLIWYFFFSIPKQTTTLGTTANPLEVSTTPARFGFITNYFTGVQPEQTTTTEITPAEDRPLVLIWNKPTAGNTFVYTSTITEITSTSSKTVNGKKVDTVNKRSVRATSTVLMFVDRTTGYVYGHSMETGITYQISNTTIPGVYDAYIFNNGKQILLRFLDNDGKTILSKTANVPNVKEGGNPSPLSSTINLPKNIKSVAVNGSSDKISYLISSDGGSSFYTITNKGTSFIASSPFSEWSLFYGGDQLYATSKPSAYVEGTTVTLPSFTRIIGNKTGLNSISFYDGTLLNSMWSNSGLATFLFSKNGEIKPLNIKTLAQKCSWGKTTLVCAVPSSISNVVEGLPDDWYQGRIQFSDSLSYVNFISGEVYPLYSFESKVGGVDITNLKISSDEKTLSFIRKQDSSLWLLRTDLISGN